MTLYKKTFGLSSRFANGGGGVVIIIIVVYMPPVLNPTANNVSYLTKKSTHKSLGKPKKNLFLVAMATKATTFFPDFFFELQKKVIFLSGQDFTLPSFLLVAGPLKKELFCGFPSSFSE